MKPYISLIVLFFPFLISAQPGKLDKRFGDSGIVLDKKVSGLINAIALQSDGKIIAGGAGGFNDTQVFRLARYNADGSIDETFGTYGFTGGSELSQIVRMAVQPNDAIIAVGSLISEARLAKYKKNGGLDSSFGTNGIVIIKVGKKDVPADIALQPDGKIVVGGFIINAENEARQFFLLRYLPSGSLDGSFAEGGVKVVGTVDGMKGLATLNAIALQKDGKIVVTTDDDKPYVYRYNPDGSTDTEFGTDGRAFFSYKADRITGFSAKKIAVQEDGKIVGGGRSATNAQHVYISAARTNADGSIDSSFGKGGLQYITYGNENADGNDLLLQADGRIVVSGFEYDEYFNYGRFAVARFSADGEIDSTFGDNGITITATEGFAVSQSAALQKDGKIVLGGYTTIGSAGYFVLARYNNDISRRQQIITRIRRWLQHHGITWQGDNNVRFYTVQKSVDGGVTYQPVAKLYNHNQSSLSYEDITEGSNNNALYRVSAAAKDGSRSLSNSISIGSENNVKLFPNPVRSTLQIQGLPTDSKTNITVTDFSGNVRTSTTTSGSTASINTAGLKPGNYLLKVQSGNTITTHPFIKQ